MILIFETSILLTWFLAFSFEKWRDNKLEQLILLSSLFTTFIMEVINDVFFGPFGMVYPQSFFFLKPFKFPIPIVLTGSLYCWLLHILSLKFSKLIFKKRQLTIGYPLTIMILLNSWYFIELIGQKSGYWVKLGGIQYTSLIILLTYFFYFCFTVPSITFSFFIHNLFNKNKKNAPHIVFEKPSS